MAWLGSSLLPGRNPGFGVSVKPGLAQDSSYKHHGEHVCDAVGWSHRREASIRSKREDSVDPAATIAASIKIALLLTLTITDLFVVGLGVELVGAWLIARGLLIPLPSLKTFGTHAGIGVADVVDRARNRIDGQLGVALLLLGFALQLLGYLLELDGGEARQGQSRLLTALVLLGSSMLVATAASRTLRDRMFKRTLVKIAMAPLRTSGGDIEQSPEENIKWLASYGIAAGWQRQMYESDETYVKRVFGIELP